MEFDLSNLFQWSSRTYSLQSFVDDHRNTFPRVVQVVEGFCPDSEEETLENGQILILHEVRQEQFVVVTRSGGTEVCIPRKCPFKVELVPLDRLDEEYSSVEELFMAQPDYFRTLNDIPSLGIESGSVMRICSRQNGVYHLECEAIGHASCQGIVKLPLKQQGQFQPLRDGREYTVEQILESNSALQEIGIRFIDWPGSNVSTEMVPLRKGFRLLREFQQCTIVATSVLEGVDDQLLLFPATLDLTIAPTLDFSEGMKREEILFCQRSKLISCLKQVDRMVAGRAHSFDKAVRAFSLECLTPPPLTSLHKTRLPPIPAKEKAPLPPRPAKSDTHHSSDVEVTPEKMGLLPRTAKSHSHQNFDIEVTPALPRQEEPLQGTPRSTDSLNPSADIVRKDNDNIVMTRANYCVEEDRSQASIESTPQDKSTRAHERDKFVYKPRIAPPLPKREDKLAQVSNVNSSETHSEGQIRDLPHTNQKIDELRDKNSAMLGSSQFTPDGRPIPKPRKLKKTPVASPLSVMAMNPNSTSDENSACRDGSAIGTFRCDRENVEVSPQVSHELPSHLGYVNVASQNKVVEATEEQVTYHMSGNTAPTFTVQRTRYRYHKEIVTLRPRHEHGEENRYRVEQDGTFEDFPIYVNENPFPDTVVRDPGTSAGFEGMMSDASPFTMRYVNEHAFSGAAFHRSHLCHDRATSTANVERQGALVSSVSHQSTPHYVNNSHRNPSTEMVAAADASKAFMDYPYINYKPDFQLCKDEQETSQMSARSQLQSSFGDYKYLNESREAQSYSNLQLPHGDANGRHFSEVENEKTVNPSESQKFESRATNNRLSESEDKEDSVFKWESTGEDGYCAMDQGEPRERSDSYSYPYAHFLFPRSQSPQSLSQLRLLMGWPSETVDSEEGIPELPKKPAFLRPLEETWETPQPDPASATPSLPPKKKVMSPSLVRKPSYHSDEDDDKGAYLVVDLVNDLTPEEQHEYLELDDVPGEVVFPIEVPETCAISQNEPPLCAPAPPPRRPRKSKEEDPSIVAYDGIYSIIPDDRNYKEYDTSTTQATCPLPQRIKFSPIGFLTGKAKKKKLKQKKRTEEKTETEHCSLQAQIEHLAATTPTLATHREREHQNDFEDLDTASLFLKMRSEQEAELSRQKAFYEAEIARQKALCSNSEQDVGTDDTTNQDSCPKTRGEPVTGTRWRNLAGDADLTCANNELPFGASSGGRGKEPTRDTPASPRLPTKSVGSCPGSGYEGDSNEARSCTKSRKILPVPKPRKRN